MPSPFKSIVKTESKAPSGERVEGAFDCDTCHKCVGEAWYEEELQSLTWECEDGHINNIRIKL